MGSTAHDAQFNRTTIYVSLGLAVALVLGVLVGARVFFNRVALQPVAMTEVPAPEASSSECTSLIDALPPTLASLERAELAEPAPEGAAAWQASSTERITLRCGVDAPAQYTPYAQTEDIDGARWLRVNDATPGSTLATWFTVDRSPVLAVTADTQQLRDGTAPVEGLDTAALTGPAPEQRPAPLADLAAGADAGSDACGSLLAAAPESIAEGYTRVDAVSEQTVAWSAAGQDAIVLRCGVADPENYGPGARLDQINGVPWFEDVKLANGTTASTWYAMGRDVQVAASLPQVESNEAITNLTNLIAEHTAQA
ncbi:DUF3515 domain-containing protein [Corynebacterium afermentans subsp. lipophilum]|uniref:DUF3515 domain-containing protein n=1 Tax=Corynebacterium afermentans TaxID=38286 RepID=UPI001889CAD9|nr:DUF3515 domain-containing protein [Corynebacterium afermentans]MBF4548387.1 DUF3515 domain-containing protein [Corynebacterium afermentans subsp. lipophilum]WJY58780.1 hypothetical protein CAFEL_05035 [Corynebacterium afermentans subsp. lipophilum]